MPCVIHYNELRSSLEYHALCIWDRSDPSTNYIDWVREFNGTLIYSDSTYSYYIEFESEEDAVVFKLKFS